MNTMMLAVMDEFVEWIKRWPIILALVLCVLGVSLGILARRITRVVRKTNEIDDKDRLMITLKVLSIVMLFISVLIVVLL